MFSPMDPMAMAGPVQPVLQRYRDMSRQRTMTLADLLMENRILFVGSSPETGGDPRITDYLANITIQKLLYLVTENKTADVHMYINSPGGSVSATLAMYDCMQFMECPINTYCMGMAASGAAILLAAGSKGKRYALPHSKVMIHQPYGQVGGQVSDIEIQANEILRERERLNEILARHTGQPIEKVALATERDRYYTAVEAKDFGIVDDVLLKTNIDTKKA
jgi:ATP-dependent Clp protease, protease subunit